MNTSNPYEVVPFDPAWLDEDGLMTNALNHDPDAQIVPESGPYIKLGYQFMRPEQALARGWLDEEGHVVAKWGTQEAQLARFAAPDTHGGRPPSFRIEPLMVQQDVVWKYHGHSLNAVAEIYHNRLYIYAKDAQGNRIQSPVALIERRALFYFEGALVWGSTGTHNRYQYESPNLRRYQDWTPVYRLDIYRAIHQQADALWKDCRDLSCDRLLDQVVRLETAVRAEQPNQNHARPKLADVDDILLYHVFDSYVRHVRNHRLDEGHCERVLEGLVKRLKKVFLYGERMKPFFDDDRQILPVIADAYHARNEVIRQAIAGVFHLATR